MIPRPVFPITLRIEVWVVPRAALDAMVKERISTSPLIYVLMCIYNEDIYCCETELVFPEQVCFSAKC